MPVYDCLAKMTRPHSPATGGFRTTAPVAGSGNNIIYHINGYAAFYLTGWHLKAGHGGHGDKLNPNTATGETIAAQGDIRASPGGSSKTSYRRVKSDRHEHTTELRATVVKPAG